MSLSIEICIIAAIVLLYADIVIICRLMINRISNEESKYRFLMQFKVLLNVISGKLLNKKFKITSNSYREMKLSFQLDSSEKELIEKHINVDKLEKKYLRRLNSIYKIRRMEAAVQLGLFATENGREALKEAILKERDYPVKLYIANALTDICSKESIPVLVESLINSHHWYRDKVNMLILEFGEAFNVFLPVIKQRDEFEIKELIVDFSSIYFSESIKTFLVDLIDTSETEITKLQKCCNLKSEKCCAACIYGRVEVPDRNRMCKFKGIVSCEYKCGRFRKLPVSEDNITNYQKLVYKATETLGKFYPKEMYSDKYLKCNDITIKNIAVRALAEFNSYENFVQLLNCLENADTSRSAVNSVSRVIERNPEYINTVVSEFNEEKSVYKKDQLAEVLASRIEYFIMKLTTKNKKSAADIITKLLFLGRTSEIIDFLNKNKDIDLENELCAIIKMVISNSVVLEKEFCIYLDYKILQKCGLTKCEDLLLKREEKKDKNLIRRLYLVMIIITAFFPLVYLVRHNDILLTSPLIKQIKTYIIDFNYYLAFYSITINFIYIMLLVLSFLNVKRQKKLWKIKSISLLFKKRMLPSISIIAPAFNEEKTILESVNSLLNLKYPDYELVIVNDGSKDETLNVLIKSFDLKRIDYVFDYKLSTKPVRGVYLNRSIPKLIVVDKENGGKADSLNTGINISNKEYFCGIDADSLLEDEALLKLASLTLDEGVETPALGGNIFPINGCTVDRGLITDIKVPHNKLARFQTVEYIRSFMAGRLGWAYINSLLIISGAFGLFRKERVTSVGGYLTSSGKYGKDTVGEDMELVVRISRFMKEKGLKYKVRYAFNANCWTEVPEDLKSLKKQRYRWHRGLIDILSFHKKMIFNPRYGKSGMIAMPYFFIFEMIGPLIEIQGYVMVILAFFLGLLNAEIAILLFLSTILMGVLVSLSSILIAEKDFKYFKNKDIVILVFFSILENFGPRQLFSFWRVGGYLNMLRKPAAWGKIERKGFVAKGTTIEG